MPKKASFINKRFMGDVLFTIAGALISAIAYNMFIIPFNMLSGGVTGASLLLNYLTKISVSGVVLLINIPLFILGIRSLGKPFMIKSFIGMVSFSAFLELTSILPFPTIENPLIAAIFGGAVNGLGGGMALYRNSSMGGTDIVTVILNKKLSIPIGSISMGINVFILALAALLFGLEIALLSVVQIFISTRAIDAILQGLSRRKTVMIISHRYPIIMRRIQEELGRGVTIINASGGFSGEQRQMLYCIVHTLQLAPMRSIIHEVDPDAFYSVIETSEVRGRGFHKSVD